MVVAALSQGSSRSSNSHNEGDKDSMRDRTGDNNAGFCAIGHCALAACRFAQTFV